MSDKEVNTANAADEALSNDEAEPVIAKDASIDVLRAELEQALSTKKRILNESKSYKSKYQELRKEVETKTNKELEEQQKYKELYEKASQRSADLEKKFLRQQLNMSLQTQASKAGWTRDIDVLMKLGKSDLLQIDEDGVVHGADIFVDEVKKEYPMLFANGKQSVINPIVPGGATPDKKVTAQDYAKMKDQDRVKVLTQLLNK